MPDAEGEMPSSDKSMSMPMTMVMTFGKWSDYQVTLLFDSWDIKTKSQYVVAWFGVVLAVVCWHGLKYLLTTCVEDSIRNLVLNTKTNSHDDSEYSNVNDLQSPTSSKQFSANHLLLSEGKTNFTWKKILILRVVHAFIAACIYALALLLMLVSMTYNCGLFLALVVGYFIGDILFFMLGLPNSSANVSEHECH